jgi:hypothetical protein
MKHVTYADKSLLVDDDTADCLLEYARVLGMNGGADTVMVRAVGADGNEVEATFLLNSSTEMMAETASANMRPPANPDAVAYMREQIDLAITPPTAKPEPLADVTSGDGQYPGLVDL